MDKMENKKTTLFENKKAMLMRNWIVIGVLISMIFISAGTWINTWDDIYYENGTTTSNVSTYNYIGELGGITDDLEGELQSDNKPVTIGFLDFVITGGYNILVAIIQVPRIMLGVVYDAGANFGIPTIYITGFIILISVALIFGIVGAIFRRKT